jgi:hypothetical protein
VVLVLVSIVVFLATQGLGDPARHLGRSATPANLAALRDQLHLDRPLIEQYLSWAAGLLHGDAGMSLAAQELVTKLIADHVINSALSSWWRDRSRSRSPSSSARTPPFGVTRPSMSRFLSTLVFAALRVRGRLACGDLRHHTCMFCPRCR